MTAQARVLGGRYQVGELLGFGGMAEVHRGRDTRLERQNKGLEGQTPQLTGKYSKNA